MRDAIYNLLTGDSALMTILTGGVHKEIQVTRQYTPTAFDSNGEVLPCALLRLLNDVQEGPYNRSSGQPFALYLYQRSGLSSIDSARARIYTLLHRQKVTPVNGGTCWGMRSTDEILDVRDPILDANLAVLRYRAVWNRP